MADIWHTIQEVPELNKNVLANNTKYKTVAITVTTQLIFISDEDLIRWRYPFEPDVWHDKTDIPPVGSTVLGEYKEYRVWDLKDGSTQTQFINDSNIVRWAYWEDALSIKSLQNNKILNCIKEGEDNDWAPTVNGNIILESDVKALKQQINARIQTLPNEVDGFDGIDYLNVIFGNTTWAVKAQALIDVIKEIPSVKDVLYVSSAWTDKIGGEFKITFAIESVFGKINFAFGIDEQNKTINLN